MFDYRRMTAIVADVTDHSLSPILSQIGIRVLAAQDAAQVVSLQQQYFADMVFADILLPGMEVTALFRQMQRSGCAVRPGCALTCVTGFPVPEAGFPVLPRPYAPQDVLSLLPQLLPEHRAISAETRAHIENMLDRLGIPEHHGKAYLCSAIGMTINDSRLSGQLSARLYPAIAAAHGASPAQVERAIRHCIDTAWRRGSAEEQYRLFGNTIDAQRGKPTVGAMIARGADILRLEESV